MIEVYPKLFVGNQQDYDLTVKTQADWRVVHACKEPYHRQALGYGGREGKTKLEVVLCPILTNKFLFEF